MTIKNPYIVGNPIEDRRMFFGRTDDFAYLNTKMAGADRGGFFVLCGTRRSGKTSVLFQIQQGRLGDRFLPVLVDMQANPANGDVPFVRHLTDRIAASLDPEGALDLPPFEAGDQDFRVLRDAFIGYCRRVRAANGHRNLVLMFDEYELFEDAVRDGHLTRRILDLLGAMVQGDSGIFIVMAGSTKLEERDPEFWASCLGQSLHRRISFLSRKDALLLITEPVAGSVSYEPGVPERLLDLGAGQPFYTQVLCQGLVDRLNEEGETTATAEDVDQVVRDIVDNPLPHMIFTWGSLSDVEKVALAAMAEIGGSGDDTVGADDILAHLKTEKTGITLATDLLSEGLERLFVEDLLDKDEGDERYTFRMGLWHSWVSRMHSVWQVLEEIKADGRKPDKGVISLARRRFLRTLAVLAFAAVATGLFFVWEAMQEPVVVLAPDPDSTFISFVTDPPGARFFLDDRELKGTAGDSIRVPAGRFEYRAEMKGFRGFADSVTLLPDTFLALFATLEEETGSIRVETTPPGAVVTVDNTPRSDPTPTTVTGLSTLDLHRVSVRLAGYLPATYNNIQVVADSTSRVSHDFRKPRHALTLATVPSGAALFLDGQDLGPSPVSLPAVVEGTHAVRVTLDGYYGQETQVSVPVAGNRLSFSLAPLPPGLLRMQVLPYGDFYLEGERIAVQTVSRDTLLSVGTYQVEFRHPTSGTFTKEVQVTTGDTVSVHHTFGGRP